MITRAAKDLQIRIRSGDYTFDADTREGWLGFRAELERVHATAEWPEWTRDRLWGLATAELEEFVPGGGSPLLTAVLYGRAVDYTRAMVEGIIALGSLP